VLLGGDEHRVDGAAVERMTVHREDAIADLKRERETGSERW